MQNIILQVRPIDGIDNLIASLEKDWAQIAPDLPFHFSFLDDNLNLQYENDQQFSRLIIFFGGLVRAVFLSH